MNKYIIILLLAGSILSCKTGEKSFPLFRSKSTTEKILQGDALLIRAAAEKAKGNLDQAEALYKASLKQEGNPAAAHFELSQLIYSQRKDYPIAMQHIQEAMRLDENNKWYLFFYLTLNEENARPDLVEAGYNKLIKIHPENMEYRLQFADFYIQHKKYDQALNVYNQIEEKVGVSEGVNKNKFLINKGLKRDEKAIKELKKLIEAFPLKERYYMELADMYRLKKDTKNLELVYENALQKMPYNTEIMDEYGHYCFLSGKMDTAYALHQKVLSDENYSVGHKLQVLDLYLKYEKLDSLLSPKREHLFLLLQQKHATDFQANKYLGEHYFRRENYGLAKTHFLTALAEKKNSFGTWQQLVMTDHRLEDYDAMAKDAEEGIIYFPAQSQLYYYQGLAQVQLERFDKGIKAYEEGLLYCSGDIQRATFLSALGDAYHSTGNHAKSDESFEQSLALDSLNAMVLNNYAYYLSERKFNLKRAEEMSFISNTLRPGTASFNDTYGWILYQMGKYDNALEWLLKAENNGGGESAIILEHIGDTYRELKKIVYANQYYYKALQLGGTKERLTNKIKQL